MSVIDSDLSTVTADADKAILVDDPEPWIERIELQASRFVRLEESNGDSTLLELRHLLQVRTSVVLLRPAADAPERTAKLDLKHRGGTVYDTFVRNVATVTEQPLQELLARGLTVLPLAPVSRVEEAGVPEVLLAMSRRLERETPPQQAATVRGATKILMGARYEEERGDAIIQGVSAMRFANHGIEEARTTLLHLGRKKFGPPDARVGAQIAALEDFDPLYELTDRVLDAASWEELLAADDVRDESWSG